MTDAAFFDKITAKSGIFDFLLAQKHEQFLDGKGQISLPLLNLLMSLSSDPKIACSHMSSAALTYNTCIEGVHVHTCMKECMSEGLQIQTVMTHQHGNIAFPSKPQSQGCKPALTMT